MVPVTPRAYSGLAMSSASAATIRACNATAGNRKDFHDARRIRDPTLRIVLPVTWSARWLKDLGSGPLSKTDRRTARVYGPVVLQRFFLTS